MWFLVGVEGGGQRAGIGGKLPWDKVLQNDTKNKKHKIQSKIIQQHLYQSDRLAKISKDG